MHATHLFHQKLLAYAIRLPCDNEPALKQVVLAVEEVVEQAVRGLGTLSIDALHWLQSAKPNEQTCQQASGLQALVCGGLIR
jgi:hypothetical protein